MGRSSVEDSPEFEALKNRVEELDSEIQLQKSNLKKYIQKEEALNLYNKYQAVITARDNGLSVYGIAKALGIKSSAKRASVVADAEAFIKEYDKNKEAQ